MVASVEIPSPDLRMEVWKGRIEADMRQRYFARMAQVARARDRRLRVAVFFTSSATGVTALVDLGLGPGVFGVVTALLVAVSFTLEFGSVATSHTGFAVTWEGIYADFVDLWIESEQGNLSHQEVREALRRLEQRIVLVDQQSVPYRVNKRVLLQCFDRAEAYAPEDEVGVSS